MQCKNELFRDLYHCLGLVMEKADTRNNYSRLFCNYQIRYINTCMSNQPKHS